MLCRASALISSAYTPAHTSGPKKSPLPDSSVPMLGRMASTGPTLLLRPLAEELNGKLAGGLGDHKPPRHARDLVHALACREWADGGHGTSRDDLLFDEEVHIAAAGDLRQVCDAEDLTGFRQGLQLTADDLGHPTANAGVDLVKHQGGDLRYRGQDPF